MPEDFISQVVGALVYLEKKLGTIPSVKDIAEQAGLSNGTTHKYLKEAEEQGLIVQREGRFMSLRIAQAFDKQKEGSKE